MLRNKDLIYPELSYKIIGACFSVANILGHGHKEIYYQKALAKELKTINLLFQKEPTINLMYKGEKIGRYIPDFIVDDKIIVELKVATKLGYTHIRQQVLPYLKAAKIKLALLVYFTQEGVKYRRIINSYIN